ncbi:MAG: ECF transporter S component [Firmicutes bacterium]|nr:ECF transporter S component [Bacillota bacterium]
MKKNKISVRTIAFVGVLGALSAVLMLVSFPLPFAPSFLKFDLSDIPGLFAGFFLGPAAGCLVALVKILLNFVLNGTTTAGVGELSNLCGSCVFILTAALIYRSDHTKKGAMKGLVCATFFTSVLYVFMNAFVMFPLYGKLYGLSTETIVAMGSKVNPLVKDNLTMMLFAVLPFNLVKYCIVSLVTALAYKKCSNALRAIVK